MDLPEYQRRQDMDADEARHPAPIAAPAAQDPNPAQTPARRGRGRARKHPVDHPGANANSQPMILEFRNECQTIIGTMSRFFQETEQRMQRFAGVKLGRGRPRKYAQAPPATTPVPPVVPVATARATRGAKRARAGPSSSALPADPSEGQAAFPLPDDYIIRSESEKKEEAEDRAASDSPDRSDESSGDSGDHHQAVSESEDDDDQGHVAWTDVEVGQYGSFWP